MDVIKKGDLVWCKYMFIFSAVNDKDLLTIRISRVPQEKDYIIVPLYLNKLGFYLPEFDYCLPGSYLPITHPDYYRETGDGHFWYNNMKCKLSFDPDFMYCGKYWLIPTEGGPILKYARLRNQQLRNEATEVSLGQELSGELIEGRLLEFIIRDKATNEFVGTSTVVKSYPPGDRKVFGYLQDPITGVEFEFPFLYLTNKP